MFKFTVVLFPTNLFRSFSNQHHFPEKTTKMPLKLQLISHLRNCSHFLRFYTTQDMYTSKASLSYGLRTPQNSCSRIRLQVFGMREVSILRTKAIKRYFLSKELFERNRNGNLFVGFTLEAQLVSSKHLIQMHLYFKLAVKVFYLKYKLSITFLGNSVHAYQRFGHF